MVYLVEWSIDYSYRGDGYEDGLKHFDSEEEARFFISKEKAKYPPKEEKVYPQCGTVTLKHPGFTATLYRAEEI